MNAAKRTFAHLTTTLLQYFRKFFVTIGGTCGDNWSAFSHEGQTRTFSLHAHRQTLHVSAVLAAVPLTLVDEAVPLVSARVRQVLAHGSLEETLAAFATVNERERSSTVARPFTAEMRQKNTSFAQSHAQPRGHPN